MHCAAHLTVGYLTFRDFALQRTFAFIKPDAMERSDEIKRLILEQGFTIVKSRRMTLNQEQAALFYNEHNGKEFFADLVAHMSSGQIHCALPSKLTEI